MENFEWWQQLLLVVVGILGSVLMALVPVFILWLKKKWNIETSYAIDSKMAEIIKQGIGYAEQKSIDVIKAGKKSSSKDKLDNAVAYILEEFERLGFKDVAEEWIIKQVEALLGESKVDNSVVYKEILEKKTSKK